jgi:type I restriction enzyme S subunit
MASEWTTFRLGNVCSKIGSGATPRGGGSVYLDQGDIALIRSQNIYNDGFHHEGVAYLTEQHAAELRHVEVAEHDVLLNITGDSVARSCQVDPDVLPARVNQHVAIIRPDPTVLWPRFLRYYLVSPAMQAEMLSLAGAGATRNALTKGMIESFEVPAPMNIDEQRAIAYILGTLEDKIQLNRRMNETLEEMARALFKSWLVDFEPVRAKAEGRDLALPRSLAGFFPDSFEDSEAGEIPIGWKALGLDEIARFLNGLALQKFPPQDGRFLPVIKIAQLRTEDTVGADMASADLSPEYVVEDGDVLFSWSGSLECILWTGGRGALNQHLFKVTSDVYPKWFYFLWIRHYLDDFRSIAAGKATTMGHIQRHHLSAAKVVVPPDTLLKEMNGQLAPLIDRIVELKIASKTLAAVRDVLLPKLISGELRIKDPARILGGQV